MHGTRLVQYGERARPAASRVRPLMERQVAHAPRTAPLSRELIARLTHPA